MTVGSARESLRGEGRVCGRAEQCRSQAALLYFSAGKRDPVSHSVSGEAAHLANTLSESVPVKRQTSEILRVWFQTTAVKQVVNFSFSPVYKSNVYTVVWSIKCNCIMS